MALLAVLPEPPVVFVLVAVHAITVDSKEGAVLVADLDGEHFGPGDVLRGVAAVALQSGVFTRQGIPSLAVVEFRRCWSPLNKGKVDAVVLGMAPSAFLAGVGFQSVRGVQPTSSP